MFGSVKLKVLGVAVMVSASLAACSQPPNTTTDGGLQGKVTLTGSSTVAPLVGELGKRFEAENPSVRVDVQTGGSSRGLADARNGTADLGMVSRDLKLEENDLQAHAIARDGLAIIVHGSNPVEELSNEQIVAIYTGNLSSWGDVGGLEEPISVVNKAEGRSTLEVFLKYFQLKNSDIEAQVVIGDNEQGIKTVTGNPSAIGYVSIGAAESSIARGEPLKMLFLEGVEPSTQTVLDGTFPLARTLNLVSTGELTAEATAFVEFARSDAVHDIVEQLNLVPIQ